MKILFIQLPLIDHGCNYIESNVPYAAATNIGYIKNNFPNIIATLIPESIANYGSDNFILNYIKKEQPDIIAFSNYLWNVERHLEISSLVKKEFPKTKIIFGGPECSNDSFLFEKNRDSVDIFFSGEGEWFFKRYFSKNVFNKNTQIINNNRLITQPTNELVKISEIADPNILGILSTNDGSMTLELTRGCPYRCGYCFYSKNHSGIRELDFSLLTDAIINNPNLTDIYILSPTFNKTSDFKNRLIELKNLNHNISLHAEMRTNGIDIEMAQLIYDAGFKTLEVGLQTLTKEALKLSGRGGDVESEIYGIMNLLEVEVELKIGIIPGLPGDSAQEFKKTVDRLVELDLADLVEYYPLMVLPGTKIRNYAELHSINYQKLPPYLFTGSDSFKKFEVKEIKRDIENLVGFSEDIISLPDFVIDEPNSIGKKGARFSIDIDTDINDIINKIKIHTNIFSFHINIKNIDDLKTKFDRLFKKLNNGLLFNLIINSNELLDDSFFNDIISKFSNDSFYSRLKLYSPKLFRSCIRIYQVVDDLDLYKVIKRSSKIITPILKLTKENLDIISEIKINDEISLLVSLGLYEEMSDFLLDTYEDILELVKFESFDDKKSFYDNLDIETTSTDYSFSILNV